MIVGQAERMITPCTSTARWYWNLSKTHPTRSLDVESLMKNVALLLMDKERIECQVEYSLDVDC